MNRLIKIKKKWLKLCKNLKQIYKSQIKDKKRKKEKLMHH